MSRTIIVPLDGSAYAAAALPVARTFARATTSALHLVRVTPEGSPAAVNQAASYLEPIANELSESGLSVRTTVVHGDPATAVVKLARDRDADLIVMATHAHGSRSIAALTSTARRVLTESPSPVVFVHPGGNGVQRIQKLLVPVDGSPGGSLALAAATWLCRRTGASVVLLDVVVPVPVNAFAAMPAHSLGAYVDPAWEDVARSAAEDYVAGLARRLAEVGVVCDPRVTTGPVAAEIIRCAEEVEADLIVMSTHSIAWPGQAYVGSVADGVTANGRRAVLLVRREQPAGETSAASAVRLESVPR